MQERTFDDFDKFAGDYRKIHSDNIKLSGGDSYYFAEHKVLELKKQEKDINLKMLDVGCGDGATEFFVKKHFPSWQTYGIDVSGQAIDVARSRNIDSAIFQLYDGLTIPFNDNYFDVIFVAAVLHHINFSLHDTVINEIYRVLKPGGRFYLFEHNPLNPVTKYLVKTCVFDKDARLLTYVYAKRKIKTAAFGSIKRKFILFFPRKGIFSRFIKLEDVLGWLPLGAQYYYRSIK